MTNFIERVRDALAGQSPRQKHLIGVSGGRDSVALVHAVVRLGFRKLVVCHVNHGLRGRASSSDERFVSRLASDLGLQFESARVDTRKHAASANLSLEAAARALRHAFFLRASRRHRCRKLILAHHADDQIETLLFNFLRGAGAAGLAGMKARSYLNGLEILRPMLGITRAEIDSFVRAENLKYREDASNASDAHTRNRLRHGVIPAIEKAVGPSFRDAILRAAEILRVEDEWMTSLVPEPSAKLSCPALRKMPLALQRRTVRSWLQSQRVPEPGFDETERTLSLLDAAHGPAKINLPGGLHARRRSSEIFIERP